MDISAYAKAIQLRKEIGEEEIAIEHLHYAMKYDKTLKVTTSELTPPTIDVDIAVLTNNPFREQENKLVKKFFKSLIKMRAKRIRKMEKEFDAL